MSGHSKWSTIKRQKETKDKAKGQLFSKLARAITLAARAGGADPAANFRLRLAYQKAREANMPKENIDRALSRGAGVGAEAFEEVVYEGFGPFGVGVIVEAATDNRNRTGQEIKNLFERSGGTLGGPGSVSFNFEQKGLVLVSRGPDAQGTMLQLIDLGAPELEETEDGIEVYVAPAETFTWKDKIEAAGFKVLSSEVSWRPKIYVDIHDKDKAGKVLSFLSALDSHDDVQKVHANFDIPNQLIS